jgi:LacI family transcriptional regulator
MSIQPPRKTSLPEETYRVLREAIETGNWSQFLPGERLLCEQFQISRPTLRYALQRLEEEAVITNQQGKRREILLKNIRKQSSQRVSVIGLLCRSPVREMLGHTSRKVAAMEHAIHQKGFAFQLHARVGCFSVRPGKALETLIRESNVDVWILQETTEAMQKWFVQEKIPSVVSGTPFDGINLPSVDLDNEAICRHAVGLLLARRRRNLFFVTNRTTYAGDALAIEGFEKGIAASPSAKGFILRHDGTPDGICRLLAYHLKSGKELDGFIFNQPGGAFTVMSYLLGKGHRIPKDFALISRCQVMDFASLRPSIASYSRENEKIAKLTVDLAVKIARSQPIHKSEIKIIPAFIPGDSLG